MGVNVHSPIGQKAFEPQVREKSKTIGQSINSGSAVMTVGLNQLDQDRQVVRAICCGNIKEGITIEKPFTVAIPPPPGVGIGEKPRAAAIVNML